MQIFTEEVYARMERSLKGPSVYNGVEDALMDIAGDARLQNFLRAFAERNNIHRLDFGEYGRASNGRSSNLCHLDLWKPSQHTTTLSIGLDPVADVMPHVLMTWSRKTSGWGPEWEYHAYEVKPVGMTYVVRNKRGSCDYACLANTRIGDVQDLQQVKYSQIMNGLRVSLERLVEVPR
ncbi:MAG: hypothetical protein ABIH41_02335 [Nanoarchaeota archaeon]